MLDDPGDDAVCAWCEDVEPEELGWIAVIPAGGDTDWFCSVGCLIAAL